MLIEMLITVVLCEGKEIKWIQNNLSLLITLLQMFTKTTRILMKGNILFSKVNGNRMRDHKLCLFV